MPTPCHPRARWSVGDIPTWDIELRDPMTGDILHIHRRGMNGQTVALRTLSESPNFELVDVVEADADWVEAVIADTEDEDTIHARQSQ